MLKNLFLIPIVIYKRIISPLKVPTCRFSPSCSTYAYQAIHKYGVIKGLYLFILRISRCHPFHPGGYDPVE